MYQIILIDAEENNVINFFENQDKIKSKKNLKAQLKIKLQIKGYKLKIKKKADVTNFDRYEFPFMTN